MKITYTTENSINAEQALIIARTTIDEKEYSATFVVNPDGSCELSDNGSDTDTLPGDEGWPSPAKKYISEAKKMAKGWEGM